MSFSSRLFTQSFRNFSTNFLRNSSQRKFALRPISSRFFSFSTFSVASAASLSAANSSKDKPTPKDDEEQNLMFQGMNSIFSSAAIAAKNEDLDDEEDEMFDDKSKDNHNITIDVEELPSDLFSYQVFGFLECPFYLMAAALAIESSEKIPNVTAKFSSIPRDEFGEFLDAVSNDVKIGNHSSCPLVLRNECKKRSGLPKSISGTESEMTNIAPTFYECGDLSYVGGMSEFKNQLEQQFQFKPSKELEQISKSGKGCPA
jgi:hypothetical protein